MGEGQEELARFADFDDVEDADTHDAKVIVEGLRSTWSSMAGCLKKWTADDLGEQFQRPEPNREGERPWRTRQYIVWGPGPNAMGAPVSQPGGSAEYVVVSTSIGWIDESSTAGPISTS